MLHLRIVGMVVLMCAGIHTLYAQSSCSTALRVGAGYSQPISRPGTYWFTANTYDLPISVTFVPENPDIKLPVAYIDFQCDGPLPSDIANAIGEPGDDSYVDLPITREFKKEVIDGVVTYTLLIEDKYRDMMSAGGITRNVQAWVQVDIESGGKVDINPDLTARNCLNNTATLSLPQTIHITPSDSETVYVMALSQWKEDSVRFVWNGAHAPIDIWVGEDNCEFYPHKDSANVVAKRTILSENEWKLTKDSIRFLMDDWLNGGIYFVKFISTEEADLVIEKVPEQEVEGTRVRYEQPVTVKANDDEIFYFSKNWDATRFTTPSKHICKVYFGSTPVIDTTDASTYFDMLQMDVAADGSHFLEFSDVEMQWMREQAVDNYIYMRIITIARTSFTAHIWEYNDCATKNSWQLRSGRTISFDKSKYLTDYVYRMRYSDWEGYAINLSRTGAKTLVLGMRASCSTTNPTKTNCIDYSYYSRAKAGNWTIEKQYVDVWGQDYPPDDGVFYYWVFNWNKANATLTFTSTKPAEQETEIEEDCEVVITARPKEEGTGTVQIKVE